MRNIERHAHASAFQSSQNRRRERNAAIHQQRDGRLRDLRLRDLRTCDGRLRDGRCVFVGTKGVRAIYVRSGGFITNGGPQSPPNDTIGSIQVDFEHYEERLALGLPRLADDE